MSKEKDLFLIVLANEFPRKAVSAYTLLDFANKLIRLGNQHGRCCVWQCNGRKRDNGPEYTQEEYEADISKIEEKIKKECLEIYEVIKNQSWATPVFSYDPRGCTVKLKLPSGLCNSMGGEGYCLPDQRY